MSEPNAIERRASLVGLAEMLNNHRIALAKTIHEINVATALLVNEADKLLPAAVAEREGGKKMPTQIEYIADKTKQRHCSNCGEPGHTARTCTNERKIEVNDEGDVVPAKHEKKKRVMPPLTEAQKAQRRKSLEKARAARGKK